MRHMGQHQHDIDELARMERICRDLAEESALSLERAGLLEMAANYRREIWTQSRTQRRKYRTELDGQGGSRGRESRLISLRKRIGRHRMIRCRPYSKTGGRRFEPCHSCQRNQTLS
ncbi:hypothetical protein BST65_22915 [Bradyrhizobium canariense]|nr:hypothetical protein BST65_22915 [Bradyrhizobium canariense]OSI30202.1 hypothetical protein BST66_24810 [Bradyrhizobium canariense]OSI38514.1 hypothetical protein BSZ20_36860 [Bradyrhizobium canariense]OSI46861.1 hypothetical protein BST67_24105 [Bradyrhizobium canariense]OSI50897.1 hypothetical protein BSZ15_32595 [Bradyrhizobium canariense]